jgi:branched-chain amino acid transport system ATP-binding protein
MLEVQGIDAFYGAMQVLWDVSIHVGNETVMLIGPNGHGKTSILNVLSGLTSHKKGRIQFDGEDIGNLPAHEIVRRGVVHIPEGGRLFPLMTVIENLKIGAYQTSAWKTKDKQLERVFELFPILKERKNQLCSTLSGGERRMVSIGRGLMAGGKILLIDEPSLGLAPAVQLELIQKIADIRRMGISILMAEQNVRFVEDLADRIYLIESGKVALEGPKDKILDDKYLKTVYLA